MKRFKKSIRVIISMVLVLAMLGGSCVWADTPINTEEQNQNKVISDSLCLPIKGEAEVFRDIDEYYNNNKSHTVCVDGKLSLDSRLAIEISIEGIVTTGIGDLFSFDDLGQNTIIAADIISEGPFRILGLVIAPYDGKQTLKVTFENSQNNSVIMFECAVEPHIYSGIKKVAAKNTYEMFRNASDHECEIKEYLISLLLPGNKCLGKENKPNQTRSTDFNYDSMNSTSGYYASLSELDGFFNDLYDDGSASPSSSIIYILGQTGWRLYKGTDYLYIMYSQPNGTDEQLVSLTVVTLSRSVYNNYKIERKIHIKETATFSFNSLLSTASIIFYNTGIQLENAKTAVELVGGDTYFVHAEKTYSTQYNASILNLMFALAEDLGLPSSIWTALQFYTTDSSDGIDYGNETFQQSTYGGLIRASASNTGSSAYLVQPGHYLAITAEFDTAKSFVTYRAPFCFTGHAYF